MTKDELGQLLSLRKEIMELTDKIEELEAKPGGMVCDKVEASSSDFPYTKISVKIEGYDYSSQPNRRLQEKKALLEARRQQAENEERKLSRYIKGIKDSKIRRIVSLRYEKGLTWEQVAAKMHYDRTYPEKLLSKYLKEHPDG
ncbi:MAG: hypothetical protein LUD50_04595 [Clostridia bacterium]|nr:hypothetical protein [Clostridia bacterium]